MVTSGTATPSGRRRTARALTWALALLAVLPACASADWQRLSSPSFEVVGDADAARLSDVAVSLELFRAAFGETYPRANLRSPAPITVYVFATSRAMAPFRPEFGGKAVEVGGAFLPGADRNLITMSLEPLEHAYPTVYHEFTHFIVQNTLSSVAVWFNEGLAEFHSTFELLDGGRRVRLGRPHAAHVRLLRERAMLPLLDLLRVTRDSPLYNEGQKRSVFYAQSWALTHYLLSGNRERTPQLFTYLAAVDAGADTDLAFRESFGCEPAVIEKELRAYVQRQTFLATDVTLRERIGVDTLPKPVALGDSEVEGLLGELLARFGNGHEARARLERAVALDQTNGRAMSGLGKLLQAEQRRSEGLALLEEAGRLAPRDPVVQLRLALGLAREAEDAATYDPVAGERVRAVARAASRVIESRPDTAEAYALLAAATLSSGAAADAVAHARRAIELAPTRHDYRLNLARIKMLSGDLAGAQEILGALVVRGQPDRIKDQARVMLAEVAERRLTGR